MTETTWEEVAALIKRFTDQYPRSLFGPAHIALEDYNLYDDQIEWCMSLIQAIIYHRSEMDEKIDPGDYERLQRLDWYSDHDYVELIATRMFCRRLLAIDEDVRIAYRGDWRNDEDDN